MKTYSQVFGEAAAESAARLAEVKRTVEEIGENMDRNLWDEPLKATDMGSLFRDLHARVASLERAVASLLVRK